VTRIRNISDGWQTDVSARGDNFKYRELSGDRLGARVEELGPGETSSEHHYHTTEEEHVLVLEGSATLVLGEEHHSLSVGDHIWFPAGEEVAHHIINNTDSIFKFFVFGERRVDDVVFYPMQQVMIVKSLGNKRLTYRDTK
jgi:uncharacterized cupin superfamily protein